MKLIKTTFLLAFLFSLVHAAPKKMQTYNLHAAQWSFEENKGQIAADSSGATPLFAGEDGHVAILCYRNKIALCFYEARNNQSPSNTSPQPRLMPQREFTLVSRVELDLRNTSGTMNILTDEAEPTSNNYYTEDQEDGIMDVRSYKKLTYQNIYPGIDLELRAQKGGFKYSFIVHPGADPDNISIQWKSNNLFSAGQGLNYAGSGLHFTDGKIQLDEDAPYAYTEDGKEVKCNDRITGNFQDNYQVYSYDKSQTLTIDPTLRWGTYFGGDQNDYLSDMVVDKAGSIIALGWANSLKNIATDKTKGPNSIIVKFNSLGQKIWCTYYYYGSGDRIRLDTSGKIVISGSVYNSKTKDQDAFITKMDTAGKKIWYKTFGGPKDDWASALCIDTGNNIIFAGHTQSTTNISTAGAWRTTPSYMFITKLDASGSPLWSTYFGDTGNVYIADAALDASGNIYITGNSKVATGIATPGTWHGKFSGNEKHYDVFLAKFTPSGSRAWGTFYGDTMDDEASGIAIDKANNIYIAGTTNSRDSIATMGTHMDSMPSIYAASFIAKFDTTGRRVWGTYFGGSLYDYINRICISNSGIIGVAGEAYSPDSIATQDAFQKTFTGSTASFFAEFDTSGQVLYGTYLGGSLTEEYAFGIASDLNNNFYVSGSTGSDSGLATKGAYQYYNNSRMYYPQNGFLVKFSCPAPVIFGQRLLCGKNTGVYRADKLGSTYTWNISGGSITSGQKTDSITINWGTSISGNLRLTEQSGCLDSISIHVNLSPLPAPSIIGDSIFCQSSGAKYYYDPDTAGRRWNWRVDDGRILSGQRYDSMLVAYADLGHHKISLVETNQMGCTDSASMMVAVRPVPSAKFSIRLDTITGIYYFFPNDTNEYFYSWNLGDGNISAGKQPSHGYTHTGKMQISLSIGDDYSCTSLYDTTIMISVIQAISASSASDIHIRVYPDPFTERFTLESTAGDEIRSIELYDLMGRKIKTLLNLRDGANTIDATGLTASTYLLRVTNVQGSVSWFRIAKQ